MAFSVNNVFQMKVGEDEDAKKFDLFSWNMSSSYNWKADKNRLSDLSSNIQARPLKNVSFSFRSAYSFYPLDSSGVKMNRLYVKDIGLSNWKRIFASRWVRLTNINIGLNFNLRGKARIGGKDDSVTAGDLEDSEEIEQMNNVQGDRFNLDDDVEGFELPWSLNTRLTYTERRSNPQNIVKTFWVNTGFEFNLTRQWKISYKMRFDVKEKKVASQDFVFYRDLHCWEARIVWSPTGYNKQVYFKINVKSSMLQDLKVEKGSGRRGYGSY